jgi:hypothetical protein
MDSIFDMATVTLREYVHEKFRTGALQSLVLEVIKFRQYKMVVRALCERK